MNSRINGIGTDSCGVVMHIITGLGVGGAERVVLELATSMERNGRRTLVTALTSNDCILGQFGKVTVPLHILGISMKRPFSGFLALWSLIDIARSNRVTVIHAHMFHGLVAGLICRILLPRTKLVFTSHSFAGFSLPRRLLISVTKPFRYADIVFTKAQHSGLNATHTYIIPNGVRVEPLGDAAIPCCKRGRPVIIFVGRLEPAKNPIALIDAFSAMRHQCCELWMVGDGALRMEVVRRIATLGLCDRVRLLGVRTDVSNLLCKADVFVMSSRWEGLPLALLEAGAAALPVVATPVGAIPEVLSGGCGYLAEAEELSLVMDAVLDDRKEAALCGRRLHARVLKDYSLEQMGRKHMELYDSI